MLYWQPANILLNANFEARLVDFGLSKVMEVDQSHVSSEVRGTLAYVDPEYRKNHHLNASGDVYSFGIVLLQLLSGKRIISLDLTRPMPLYKMARSNILSTLDYQIFLTRQKTGHHHWALFVLPNCHIE